MQLPSSTLGAGGAGVGTLGAELHGLGGTTDVTPGLGKMTWGERDCLGGWLLGGWLVVCVFFFFGERSTLPLADRFKALSLGVNPWSSTSRKSYFSAFLKSYFRHPVLVVLQVSWMTSTCTLGVPRAGLCVCWALAGISDSRKRSREGMMEGEERCKAPWVSLFSNGFEVVFQWFSSGFEVGFQWFC